jgi:hypothetical protein
MIAQEPGQGSNIPQGANRHRSAMSGMRAEIGDFLGDVVSLSELQARLFAVDAAESLQRARTPLALLVIGSALGLAGAACLLFASAEALVLLLRCERALAYLASGLAGSIVAAVLLSIAWQSALRALNVFTRSRTELAENVRWIRVALSGRQGTK